MSPISIRQPTSESHFIQQAFAAKVASFDEGDGSVAVSSRTADRMVVGGMPRLEQIAGRGADSSAIDSLSEACELFSDKPLSAMESLFVGRSNRRGRAANEQLANSERLVAELSTLLAATGDTPVVESADFHAIISLAIEAGAALAKSMKSTNLRHADEKSLRAVDRGLSRLAPLLPKLANDQVRARLENTERQVRRADPYATLGPQILRQTLINYDIACGQLREALS